MSIFREPFPEFVQAELTKRQNLLEGKDSLRNELVNYQTTRNAWVKMTSGVNVNGSNELAKKYVLLGGTLNKTRTFGVNDTIVDSFAKKSGVGSSFDNNSYSNTGALGQPYQRGIRPMPGITNISTSTKNAYGSLIEAVISFNCWDIQQLEDLELLYMRPGYTVLLEWGWTYAKQPFITPYYDILNRGPVSIQQVTKDLFDLSKESGGNYEAILGYVKNYNWRARPDGGYDCTTTLISLGEVLESIKVNYSPYNIDITPKENPGILKEGKYVLASGTQTIYSVDKTKSDEVTALRDQYSKGILHGLLYELRLLLNQMPDVEGLTDSADRYSYPSLSIIDPEGNRQYYKVFKKKWQFPQISQEQSNNIEKKFDFTNHYITLGSLCELINNYVLIRNKDLKSSSSGSLLSKISTKDREYAGYNDQLTCLAHPLQISTDPTKCLIDASVWIGGELTSNQTVDFNKIQTYPPVGPINPSLGQLRGFDPVYRFLVVLNNISKSNIKGNINTTTGLRQLFIEVRRQIENSISAIQKNDNSTIIYNLTSDGTIRGENFGNISGVNETGNIDNLGLNILGILGKTPEEVYNEMVNTSLRRKNQSDPLFRSSLTDFLVASSRKANIEKNSIDKNEIIKAIKEELGFRNFGEIPGNKHAEYVLNQFTSKNITDTVKTARKALEGLDILEDYFVDKTYRLGNISNIYVDLGYLMNVVSNPNIESIDTQNKNTISVIDFFKEVLKTVQSCIGNINNFNLHIDKDGVGRIIDINFTDDNNLSGNKNKLFEFQLHNLKSVVRNYQLESKIFPEQGTIIAISAQVSDPGRLGYNNSTLIEYNNNVTDRLKPVVESASDSLAQSVSLGDLLLKNFTEIQKYFVFLKGGTVTNNQYAPGDYNNALRDLIGLFNGVAESNPNKFKAIIPVMLSLDIDGIGGVIVGNLFRINNAVLPSGYKSKDLGFLVKSFNHKIENNDWVTTLEAYPVVLKEENNVSRYWIDFFNKAFASLETPDESDIDVSSIREVSPNSSVSSQIVPILNNKTNIPKGVKALIEAHAQIEGFYPDTRSYRNNNPGNLVYNQQYNIFGATREAEGRFAKFPTLEKGVDAKFNYIERVNTGKHLRYPKGTNTTLSEYINIYAPASDNNLPTKYTENIIGYFKKKGITITPSTTIGEIFKLS